MKLEHVSGVLKAMFLLEEQFSNEKRNRDKADYRNNPIQRFEFLTNNEKHAERPKLNDCDFFFMTHGHNLVTDGK